MLGLRLCTLHNLYFYNTMMADIRKAIRSGGFEDYRRRMNEALSEDKKEADKA